MNSTEQIIKNTAQHVRKQFENEGSGHDWWHIQRVWNNAKHIGTEEGDVDMTVVELAALLHDIADFKEHGGDTSVGPRVAREWLQTQGTEEKTISHVCDIIKHLSFKGAGAEEPMKTKEGKTVRDADRLDAIGAIGIARCFTYGGNKGTPMHSPEIKTELHDNPEAYVKHKGTQINHFYEKLLLLKDLMLTETGKQIATERHEFMKQYLDQFYAEWDGKK